MRCDARQGLHINNHIQVAYPAFQDLRRLVHQPPDGTAAGSVAHLNAVERELNSLRRYWSRGLKLLRDETPPFVP